MSRHPRKTAVAHPGIAVSRRPRPILLILLVALCVKLIVLWQLHDHPLLQADAGLDTTAYVQLAHRVAGGDLLLGPGTYFISPLYIYFLGTVLAVFDSLMAVRVVQILLGTCATWCIYAAARQWLSERPALLAAGLAAATGVFTFSEVLVIQAALDVFLVSAALAALAIALSRDRARWYATAGVAFGLATLNRPNMLAPALVIGGLVLLRSRRHAATLGVGLVVALAPVAIRNGIVANDWSPLPSQGGLNFYIGNNPAADGTYRPLPGIRASIEGQQFDARAVAGRALGRPVTDRETSSYFWQQGIAWVRANPGRASGLYLRKLWLTCAAAHVFLNYSYPFFAYDMRTMLAYLPVGAWILMPLGIAGLFIPLSGANRARYAIWVSFVPVYALTTAAFFAADRYRLPLLVPMCIGAGACVDAFLPRHDALPARPRVKAMATAVCVLLLLVNWPLAVDNGRGEERARMAERLIQVGDYRSGEQWAALAAEIYPRPAVLHVRVGRQFMQARQWDAARAELERAAALEPNEAEVQYRLGQALLEAGSPAAAGAHLRAAVTLAPNLPLAGYDLARALAATGDRAGALAALREAQPSTDEAAQNDVAFGELAMQLHDAALAEMWFHRAVTSAPAMAAAHQQLGLALGVLNRLDEAAAHLRDAIRLDGSDPVSHLNLAVVYAQGARFADARAEAHIALQLDPHYAAARELLTALPQSIK